MPIPVISKIVQRNNGKFKLMDAANVSYDGSEEISIKDKVDELAKKHICFIIADAVQGVQPFECIFPYNGKIESIHAVCTTENGGNVELDIEKTALSDRAINIWTSILDDNKFIINEDGTQLYTIQDDTVNKYDIFRISVLNNTIINSLTINIEINIK